MTVKAYLQSIGSKGGKVGGKSTSPAKLAAAVANVSKARAAKFAKRATLPPVSNHTTPPKQTQPRAS